MTLKVAIEARLVDGVAGGVLQAVVGLAAGLSRTAGPDEEYVFLTLRGAGAWLRPYLSGPCRAVEVGEPPREVRRSAPTRALRAAARVVRDRLALLRGPSSIAVPASDGFVERERFDLVHFPTSLAFTTDLPTIYQPWDLQHVHLPENFPPYVRLIREALYDTYCRRATFVSVASEATRRDVLAHLGLPPEKVVVVPMAAPTTVYAQPSPQEMDAIAATLDLPARFLYYPAQTFRHKNHLRLLEALALLRDRGGLTIPLLCSGLKSAFYDEIAAATSRLRLTEQVRFLGYVDTATVTTLYHRCTAVVFPSLFEGWGLPILEAFEAGAPVASSNATSLPEVAGEATLLFDPLDVAAMADSVKRLWTDDTLRATLRQRGVERAAQFSWDATANAFRVLYRRTSERHARKE